MTAISPKARTQSPKTDIRDLSFYYGKFYVLKNISLQISERQVTAFIDPSDRGKPTLLHTFNRMYALYLEQRAEGRINMDGENLLASYMDVVLLRAKVGMMFQEPTSFPISIYDNIAFSVKLFERSSRSEIGDRVEWVLTKAALWSEAKNKLNQPGYGLSGGQQQRLCIAHGITIHPEVLLLDELYSALDPIFTGRIEELITELEDDHTIVVVTHNMQQAAHCFDYMTYIYLGGLTEFGDTEETFTKPQCKETEDCTASRFG